MDKTFNRLTGKHKNVFGVHHFLKGKKCVYNYRSFNTDSWGEEVLMQTINKLVHYEDLDEQNLIPPFPLGTELFYVGSKCDEKECSEYDEYCYRDCEKRNMLEVKSFIVKQFRITENGIEMVNHDSIYETFETHFPVNKIGKTIFLTQIEAERALKRYNNERKTIKNE